MPRRPAQDVDALTTQLRLLHGAFGGGVALFALVVLVLVLSGVGADPEAEPSSVPFGLLSLVHLGVAAAGWALALLGADAVLLRRLPPSEDQSLRTVAALRRLHLHGTLRLACTEGPALLGLVLCLVAHITGTLGDEPWLALNGLSALAFVAFAFVSWPSRDRLQARLDELLR